MLCPTLLKPSEIHGTHRLTPVALLKGCHTFRALSWLMMSLEYTHNDDVADMIHAKEQEIKMLKDALQRIEAELNRITNEYARGQF
jgi:hypothetical protein